MASKNSPPTTWAGVVKHVAGTLASDFNPILAIVGFLVGGVICFWFLADVESIEKWIRFALVLLSAGLGGYVLGRLGNALMILVVTLACVCVLLGVGYFVWRHL